MLYINYFNNNIEGYKVIENNFVNLNVTSDILLNSLRHLISMYASKLGERDNENTNLFLKLQYWNRRKIND
ncbi:hypothetical protein AGMMS49921_08930 [Endomicrobiia bacterium]|nr:hypothetical protein AGMMS49921_08930 [Endomicrobiia bacterium]